MATQHWIICYASTQECFGLFRNIPLNEEILVDCEALEHSFLQNLKNQKMWTILNIKVVWYIQSEFHTLFFIIFIIIYYIYI